METAAASKEAMIEKLRLKNATLKSQIQKLEQQLQQKEEMGEARERGVVGQKATAFTLCAVFGRLANSPPDKWWHH